MAVGVLAGIGTSVDQDVPLLNDQFVTFQERLGTNLKRIREAAGISQEGLMRISDVHRTQISNYERGRTEPQAEVLARLARALGVSAEDFFAGIDWQAEPPRLVIDPER